MLNATGTTRLRALTGSLILFLLAQAVSTWGAPKGKGGKCENVPIRVTLMETNGTLPTVLAGDGSSSYEDGVAGVNGNIHICSGTGDATLSTYRTQRTILITFPEATATLDGTTPGWTPGTVEAPFFFNIRNLLCLEGSCPNPFTTRMNWRFTPPDGREYTLRFYPFSETDAPDLHAPNIDVNEENRPLETSRVSVRRFPGDCENPLDPSKPTFDMWSVDAEVRSPDDHTQLGTLHRSPLKRKESRVHVGQYQMPYRLLIEALRCF